MPISRFAARTLPSRLRKLYGRSIYGALLLAVFGALALPALVGLVRDDNGVDRPLLAAVLGPLEPPERLYGDEGDALLSQAVRKTIAAAERFAAGMLAGESDASGWQHTGAQPKRLAAEFSLLGHVFGGSTSQ